ncbi:MAG: hypothetical protein COB66_04020 [Coxiella sp. (in: Bacteria)]|nr:MAG: hypothetical protein COB66_04020 [Coxiella sp. (in: g-proteobacteria)]
MNNFEHIISERTPVKDLGTKAGIPGVKDASPLQIQEYLATRRVSSPQWFTSVQSASATSVQRQTLIVLAEIEAQNFQAHLDSERMLATMSAQTAMSGSLSANLALSKANQLNQDFKGYTTSTNQTSNSKQNKEAQQQRAQEAANKAGANN